MTNPYDIIIKPVLTEKSYEGVLEKRYTFIVDKRADKTEIKAAIEKIFDGVKVAKVNTMNQIGKMKRQGRTEGRTAAFKKAYVQLKPESKGIEILDSLTTQ